MEIEFVQGLIDKFSYAGMILAAIFSNIFPGIPEEVFIMGLGHTTSSAEVSFFALWLFLLIGLLVSDSFVYFLASRGNKFILYLSNRFTKGVSEDNMKWIYRNIPLILVCSRFIVQFRVVGPVLSGVSKFPYVKFLAWDAFALFMYVPLMLLLGKHFGAQIIRIFEGVNPILSGLILLVSMAVVVYLIKKARDIFIRIFFHHKKSDTLAFFKKVFLPVKNEEE